MNYFNAIIFGIVQGLTEFLPVSSSGHLVILHELLDISFDNDLVFDVSLHLATILAVISFFWKDILKLVLAWTKSLRGQGDKYSRTAWQIIGATIPAALAGYYFDEMIEQKFRSVLLVAVMLVLVGIFFILIERVARREKSLEDLGWASAILIGFAQAFALIPGTSRSGITTIAGLSAGLKREEAIRFSFLLSLPIILGASVTKIPQLFAVNFNENDLSILALAFVASLLSGIFAIKYFLLFSKKYSLNIFAYYRFLLATILLLLFYFG